MPNDSLLTVGVPLHNGGEQLHECLECLRTQTFTEFNVIIFENHSTDDSLSIAEAFASKDNRFTIQRSSSFLDGATNFKRAINVCAASSKYFMLRAHDDYTSPQFLEEMIKVLESNPDKDLAVSNVVFVRDGNQRTAKLAARIVEPNYFNTVWRLNAKLGFPGSWYYGLYRGKQSADIMIDTIERYPSPWAGDMLSAMRFITQNKAIFVPQIFFYCTVAGSPFNKYAAKSIRAKIRARKIYHQILFTCQFTERPKTVLKNAAFWVLCFRAARKHTGYKTRHLVRQFVKNGWRFN